MANLEFGNYRNTKMQFTEIQKYMLQEYTHTHTHTHINTMTRPGIGAGPNENLLFLGNKERVFALAGLHKNNLGDFSTLL